MFELLVFLFENYVAHHTMPANTILQQELSAAGFEQRDIQGAFEWFNVMKTHLGDSNYALKSESIRIFSPQELTKLDIESISFLTFLHQARVINDMERDLILDRVMALPQVEIGIEETRWITMMALWSLGREKEYLFVEDALYNPRGQTVH